jgi:hypothetical protein
MDNRWWSGAEPAVKRWCASHGPRRGPTSMTDKSLITCVEPLCGSPLCGSSHKIYNSGTFVGLLLKAMSTRLFEAFTKIWRILNAERQYSKNRMCLLFTLCLFIFLDILLFSHRLSVQKNNIGKGNNKRQCLRASSRHLRKFEEYQMQKGNTQRTKYDCLFPFVFLYS